ncbi:MAG: hypothetical protein AAGH78_00690 [Cyanobacteria bacterium P01_H01_bin.58]
MRLEIVVADTRVSTAELGDFHYQRFLQWALVENQPKGAFAANILKARVAANESLIDSGLEFYANQYHMSVEELQQAIADLDADGKSVLQIRRQLQQEAEQRRTKQ